MHKVILGIGKGLMGDHRNGNTLDNQKENLRLATRKQNARNVKKHRDKHGQFKGAYLIKETGKWRAAIHLGGKIHHLGVYVSERDAAASYNAAAIQNYGEFAKINNIGDII